MAEDRSVNAAAPAWDKMVNEGFGKPHGEVEGKPVSTDNLTGGSMTPEAKGFTPNKGGVGA